MLSTLDLTGHPGQRALQEIGLMRSRAELNDGITESRR